MSIRNRADSATIPSLRQCLYVSYHAKEDSIMNSISHILTNVSHRPWSLPTLNWSYSQEWNNVLFLHWQIPISKLSLLIPEELNIDTINGAAWVSLVAFKMQKIRPRNSPSISAISDFNEVNIRTYVSKDNKPGVYFLNIEAGKKLSAWIAKKVSGLPYEFANITRRQTLGSNTYSSVNKRKRFSFESAFEIGQSINKVSEIDKWLTERYCLYQNISNRLYRYEVHHEKWPLYDIKLLNFKSDYRIGELILQAKPDLAHYSTGVKVLAWQREYLGISGTSS